MPETNRKTRPLSRILLVVGILVIAALVAWMAIRANRGASAVTLGAIPFQDGEVSQYVWTQAGTQVGGLTVTVNAGTDSGKPVWIFNVEVRTGTDPSAKPVDSARVTADAATLLPLATTISTEQADGHYEINVKYSAREAGYTAETPRGPQSGATQLPGPTYDNDEVPMLIRALPLAEGYSTKFAFLQSRSILSIPASVKVEGKESLTTGSGTIPCWRVAMTVSNTKITYWYATSPDHQLIRIDGPSGIFELQPATGTASAPAVIPPIH